MNKIFASNFAITFKSNYGTDVLGEDVEIRDGSKAKL